MSGDLPKENAVQRILKSTPEKGMPLWHTRPIVAVRRIWQSKTSSCSRFQFGRTYALARRALGIACGYRVAGGVCLAIRRRREGRA